MPNSPPSGCYLKPGLRGPAPLCHRGDLSWTLAGSVRHPTLDFVRPRNWCPRPDRVWLRNRGSSGWFAEGSPPRPIPSLGPGFLNRGFIHQMPRKYSHTLPTGLIHTLESALARLLRYSSRGCLSRQGQKQDAD